MTDPKHCRLWNKDFAYVRADATDVRATFDRIREELRAEAEKTTTVRPMRKKGSPT